MMMEAHDQKSQNGAEAVENFPQLSPLAQPGQMTEMERFIFECWGYLIIPDVLTEAETDEALEAAKRVHGSKPAERFKQIGRGFETEPALENLIDHPAVLPKVRALLGDKFVLQAAFCTVMPAGTTHSGWHQDGSGSYEYRTVANPVPLLQLRASYNLTDQSELGMGECHTPLWNSSTLPRRARMMCWMGAAAACLRTDCGSSTVLRWLPGISAMLPMPSSLWSVRL